MKRTISIICLLTLVFLSVVGCQPGNTNEQTQPQSAEQYDPIAALSVDNPAAELYEGDTVQLVLTVSPATANAAAVSWAVTSGNEHASVDQSGKVTGLSQGEAVVTVSSTDGSDLSATCSILVKKARVKTEAAYAYDLVSTDKQYHFYKITSTYNGADHPFEIRVPIVEAYEFEPDEAAARMKPQIDTLNSFAKSSANVNIWLYVATVLEDDDLMKDIIPLEDLSSNFRYFASQLDPSVWVGNLDPFDIEERNAWYLATDHHWSADGWYTAYSQIIAGLQSKYPDIAFREGERVSTGSRYYGSYGKTLGALGCEPDEFVYYKFGLPAHETVVLKVNNKGAKDPGGRRLYASDVPFEQNVSVYEAGKQNSSQNFDHYVNFYPICDTVVYPENSTGRNLLFFGDSYSLSLQELIASYFDKSYFFYTDGTRDTFKGTEFTSFCQENGITDVIIVEQSTRILYDFYDYSGPCLASFYVD